MFTTIVVLSTFCDKSTIKYNIYTLIFCSKITNTKLITVSCSVMICNISEYE